MNISIIIPTRNRAAALRNCLSKLIKQITTKDEIIVADNASSDDTAEVVRLFSRTYPIKYIYEPRLGACYARNSGFKKATKTGVVFIDDDSLVAPEWLQEIKRTLTSGARRHRCVYQGQVTQRYQRRGIYELIRLRDFRADLLRVGAYSGSPQCNSLHYVFSGNMFAYRSVLNLIPGPFNADLYPFIGEELDLVCRFIQLGIPIVYSSRVRVIHTKPNTGTLLYSIRRSYLYGRSKAISEKLYFSNSQFLFKYYAHPVEKPSLPPPPSFIKKITQGNLWRLIQVRAFYTLTAIAYRFGNFVYTYMPISTRGLVVRN